MSLAARSPASRKSYSLAEHDLNMDNMTMPVTNVQVKQKKRVAHSIGGEGLAGLGKNDEMSPRRKARRSMQPRKSILKSMSGNSLSRDADNDTLNYTNTQQYAHTIAFSSLYGSNENVDPALRASTQALARRVSFAPNAHVRMFESSLNAQSPDATPAPAPSVNFALPGPSAGGPRSSLSAHSRRSSIQNIGSVSKPNIFAPSIFQGEGDSQGEASMELETDEEASDSEDEGVEMGSVRRNENDEQQVANGLYLEEADDEDAEEDEMDMDITQNVYGGIVRRASMAANTTVGSDVDAEGETDMDISQRSGDDEKTMDFTIAVGGLLPPKAPAGAMKNRNSIGYSIPQPEGTSTRNFLPGEAIEGEIEMEMEETVAFGGIIGADDSLSSGSEDTMNNTHRERTMTFSFDNPQAAAQSEHDDDGAMEMTMATGGIVSFDPVSPARSLPTNTRPMSATPSFARPTVSSVQKSKEKETATQKRNVFAPSPSPFKSTTPRKNGLQTAGEVAKRLSFGSTTSSGGKKRARQDDDEEEHMGSAKKSKTSSIESDEVFGGTPVQQAPRPVVSSVGPRRSSLGTPMRMARSPASRRSAVRVFDPEGEDEAIEEITRQAEGQQDWEQPQAISLASFLEMTGVQFMEGLPGLNRRRSSVAKGILGQSYGGGDREFALHEYAEAQVNSVFLNMYTWAANKLREDIKTGQEELAAVESRCDEDSPPVIQEYLAATDEDRQLFELTFKSFKTNTQLKAKEMWYDWKHQLMETIKPDVESMLEGMQEDNDRLSAMNEQVASLLPDLKARQAALQVELAREREIVAEIAACDQQELASYKEGIAEQGAQIAVFSAELAESSAKLNSITTKLEELNAKKQDHVAAIAHAKSQCDQFTRSDAIRLQEEYTSIQHLHLWRPTKVQPNRLELEFDGEIGISFSCNDYVSDIRTAKVEYLHERVKQAKRPGKISRGPTPTQGLFKMMEIAVREMVKMKAYQGLPELVQRIGQLWSTVQRLRAEMNYVNFRHPLTYQFDDSTSTLKAGVIMMLPLVKSKIRVEFMIGQECLWGYPESLAGTDIKVEKVYGEADVELLEVAARQTMEGATPHGCLGAFLQVCVDVSGQYAEAR
ncbi:hypothetical protein CI109_105354 [Kwoniella shandongensis]|uniref:Uncharacterized protein n=1 Tax=Kwoniella shandongensis TaxID=1734106 RepID=A0A5M6BRN5_9TREE|nr:uncharacterized protein CI109_006939 [Kwoniella shandongensis]KAA5524732.1 hypothetical protein CI109_006939 [Kwoniella shandongensis]